MYRQKRDQFVHQKNAYNITKSIVFSELLNELYSVNGLTVIEM